MRIFTTSVFLIFLSLCLSGQQGTSDFENFSLETNEFINYDATGEGFKTGYVSLPNAYDFTYDFWSSGWAISATTDTETPGASNLYSAITGSGYNGSQTYGVGYFFDENIIDITDGSEAVTGVVSGMYVNNSTFAYMSMLEGDSFAKKFGGETGEDPDFFSIVFRAYKDGALTQDSIEFFLADFRSSDSSEDFILDEWTWVDLSSFGEVERLSITMRSSDIGAFGINTPAYFCADNIVVDLDPLKTLQQNTLDIKVYPTLATNSINISLPYDEEAQVSFVSPTGESYNTTKFYSGKANLSIQNLPQGYYIVYIKQGVETGVTRIVKK